MDIKVTAQRTFDAAMAEKSYAQIGEWLAFGNSLRHAVLEEQENIRAQLRVIKAQLTSQKGKITSQKSKIASQRQMISDLQAHSEVLKDTSDGYMLIRERFLDTYFYDIEKILEVKWSRAIIAGNKAVYEGNAVADTSLFESGKRNDYLLIVKIYGLCHSQVLTLSKYSLPSHKYLYSYLIYRTKQRLQQHIPDQCSRHPKIG
jgi:hypothetical protein